MKQPFLDEQTARNVQALYNYNVGHKKQGVVLFLILLAMMPVLGLILGVLSHIRKGLGW